MADTIARMDPFERIARIIWLQYEVEIEEYDRTLLGVERHGEWIPVNKGRAESLRFARQRKEAARREAEQSGIEPESSDEFRRWASGLSFEKAKEYLADLLATPSPGGNEKT